MKRNTGLSRKVDVRKKKKQCVTKATSLPKDLTVDILSRLTVKQLMKFRCVSKTWLQLLTVDPQFLRLHYQRSLCRNPGIILHNKKDSVTVEFQYAEDYTECHKAMNLKLPFRIHQHKISGICNGLILITRENCSALPYTIWNPLTADHISFSSLRILSPKKTHVTCWTLFGLGFDQATNDYKVVRLAVIWKSPAYVFQTQVSVYSLRKASWRSLKDDIIPYRVCSSDTSSRVMVNGAFHWLAHKLDRFDTILSFDINTETIREMPFPVLGGKDNMALWELDGSLSSFQYSSDGSLDFWVMKKYGVSDSWTKHISIEKSQVGRGFIYSLQSVSIANNGDIIFKKMSSTSNKLILYDPKMNAIKELQRVPAKWMDYDSSIYTASLVSPKNLPHY